MGLAVGIVRIPVGDGCMVNGMAACVDIASSVCAADVYRAFSVAAGCGVGAAKRLHASMDTSADIKKMIFLKRVTCISASI